MNILVAVGDVSWTCTPQPCSMMSADMDGYAVAGKIGFRSRPIGGEFWTDWTVSRGGIEIARGKLDDWDTSKSTLRGLCWRITAEARAAIRIDGMERRSVVP